MRNRLKMNIYSAPTGVRMTIKWANEAECLLGKKFLTDIGAIFIGATFAEANGENPECFALETERQLDALYDFRRSLKEKRKA
jgi:hypothetical protein